MPLTALIPLKSSLISRFVLIHINIYCFHITLSLIIKKTTKENRNISTYKEVDPRIPSAPCTTAQAFKKTMKLQ